MTKSRRFGIWRYYSPASLVTGGGDVDLPAALVPTLLKLLRVSSVEAVMTQLGSATRHELPRGLQRRLLQVFKVGLYEQDSESVAFAFRPIELEFVGEAYECPFPCKPVARPIVKASVSAFTLKVKSRGKALRVSTRIGVSTNNFLIPRTPADGAFCENFLLGSAGTQGELNEAQRSALTGWLVRSGFSNSAAAQAAGDRDLNFQVHMSIRDRIGELVYVSGAEVLLDDDEQQLALDGDEESGFSR
jgi:hypothetical protein